MHNSPRMPSDRTSLAAAIFFAPILLACPVRAHEALPTAAKPLGWSYPYSCCSGVDCRQVSNKAISERSEGYVINGTGEVVAYSDTTRPTVFITGARWPAPTTARRSASSFRRKDTRPSHDVARASSPLRSGSRPVFLDRTHLWDQS
jgi:hypothetical protein